MRISVPAVAITAVATSDFDLMPAFETAEVLRSGCPEGWSRYLESPVSRRLIAELGVTNWTLSNGVRVIVKPTDFKADEVIILGTSPGGGGSTSSTTSNTARSAR